MYNNLSCNGLKMVSIMFMFLMFASAAENAANAGDSKETSKTSENIGSGSQEHHSVAKRAWQQLQGGWGKRSSDDDESIEELQRRIMKIYSEQLLSNKIDDAEGDFTPEDYDGPIEKRAWKSMGNSWGKRDWSQLRGSGWGKRDQQNWNNMRGLWGKRAPGWNKLQSAWGK